MEYSNVFVCLMGMGTVFFGLVALVLLTRVMSMLCARLNGEAREGQGAPEEEEVPPAADALIGQTLAAVTAAIAAFEAEFRPQPEVVAAVSAAIAEELGHDVSGIRILSIKKV